MTRLDTLRQLQAEATPGPWSTNGPHVTSPTGNISYDSDDADARLIAAAPTHLADLITALEREAKVREAHKMRLVSWQPRCANCAHRYPCPTIRILDGNE